MVTKSIMRRREIVALTGLSSSTIARLEARQLFPARVSLSFGRVGWRVDEIQEGLRSRRRTAEVDRARVEELVDGNG